MTAGGAWPPGDSLADQAYAATADAYASTPDGWAEAVQAAIAALFEFLADRGPQTNACIVDDCGASPESLARRDRIVDRFVELLRPGFEIAEPPPPAVVAEAIGGGIYEMVRGHVLERRLEELPAAVPDATVVALSPFLGPAAAIALATSTNVQASR